MAGRSTSPVALSRSTPSWARSPRAAGRLGVNTALGTTGITGAYNLNAGTIDIRISGLIPGTWFEQVNAATVNIGGGSTLNVSLVNAFTPTLGDTFEIITANSITGTFDTENLPALGGALTWGVQYNATDVTLEVIQALLLGDANNDGQVTGADLIAVQQNFGNVGPVPLQGDANNDGQVTGADLISVQQNFGNVLTPAPESVPEPTTLVVLTAGALLLRHRRLA